MTRLHLFIYRLFCGLEGLLSIALGGGERRRLALRFEAPLGDGLEGLATSATQRSLVVYAPTVGELNAVKPVIALYRRQWPDDKLVLFTAYAQYLELLAKTFPDAIIGLASFRTPWLIARFFDKTKPRLFIISEGPALHACFPQRLEVALPAGCLARNIPVVVANAIPFERAPQSRIDNLENALFSGLYTKAIRCWFPPFPVFKAALIREGAPADRVQMVGELRFDSLQVSAAPKSEGLESLLARYRGCEAPVLVAGSVNQAEEQQVVVNAWLQLRARYRQAKLIIAPRYVNVPAVIQALTRILSNAGADFVLRSDPASNQGLHDALVVDVFGELSHYYSVATASYIGRDHGVLEPMAYECPTIVGTGWRRNYSATPIYDYVVGERGVKCVSNEAELAALFQRVIEDRPFLDEWRDTARRLIVENSGAARRTLAVIQKLLTDPSHPLPCGQPKCE
jgi:3-deoxy-D-manno-octulosonic-acid transferase